MGKVLKSAVAVLPGAIIAGLTATGGGWAVFGAAMLAGTAAGLLIKRPKMDLVEHGTNLRLKTDPAAPRQLIYGRVATGGTLVYRETAGTDNINLHLVIALATHEIESVEGMDWAGEAVTFSGSNAVGQFANKMYLTPHMGAEDQVADSDLVADCAQWTSAHRLRGMAYVHLKLIYDTEVYKQGLQQTRFFVKGRKIYDPRLDSTNGGTGTHRLADTATWEWSDNPALIAADYLMGLSLNGKSVAGMGVDPTRIDWTSVSAQANICNEPVTLKAGGTENRYTCNGIINSSRRHGDNLGQISSAMGGNIVFQSGQWRLFAAASRPAVLGRDKQNIIGGIALTAQKGWSEKVNAIRGVYPDADVSYEAKDYPPIVDAGYVTADGGQELWMDLSLPMTTSKTMAQRLAKIALRRARMEKKTTLTLTPDAIEDQCMDAVTLTYLPFNIDGQKMLVADWALKFDADKDGNVGVLCQETLVQEDDSIYDWDEIADEQDVTTPTKANPLALNSWKGSDLKYDGGATFESLKPTEVGSTYGAFSGSGGSLRDEFGSNFIDLDIRTSLGTSEDTTYVDGVASGTVRGRAETGYQLTQTGTGTKIHQDSVYQIDVGAAYAYGETLATLGSWGEFGYQLGQAGTSYKVHADSLFEINVDDSLIGGKNAALAMEDATDIIGYEYDNFTDTSNWSTPNNGNISVSSGVLFLNHTVNQSTAQTNWKEVARGGVWEKFEFDVVTVSSESGFVVGGTYVRRLSNTWYAGSTNTGYTTSSVYWHHEFILKPTNRFDWIIDGVQVATDVAFTAGGAIGLKNEGSINTSPKIENFKHWNKPLATFVDTRLEEGFDSGGNIIRGNPYPNENLFGYDAKQEWTGGATTNHVYLNKYAGNSGDLEVLGLKVGDVITFSAFCMHSVGGTDSAGLNIYFYDSSSVYISQASVSTKSTSYERIWRTATIPAGCVSMQVWLREWGSGLAYAKEATLTRGRALTPWIEPPLRANRDKLANPSQILNPVTSVGQRATFSTSPLSSSDVGASASISFAACTMYVGGLSLSLGAGTVTGLSFSTFYYVYLTMAELESGTYTVSATTSLNDISSSNSRVFIGTVTTPANGGGATYPPVDDGGIIYP